MKQEDRKLLLHDLSARLSYGVRVDYNGHEHILDSIKADGTVHVINVIDNVCDILEVKPYLRPMNSMTEEESKQFLDYIGLDSDIDSVEGLDPEFDSFGDGYIHVIELGNINLDMPYKAVDWLNSHHFDYRGLIPEGLALPAPEDMYNF